jgi:hypothetical protein
MTRHLDIALTVFIALTACSTPVTNDRVNLSADTADVQMAKQDTPTTWAKQEDHIKEEALPIHGELDQQQIDQYYPNILDTIKDRRILGSEPIDIQTTANIYVSMLHNTGTFDQMFLCTHDKTFKLIDSYYIGTSTMFDKTGHTIEYQKTGDDHLQFHHVDWGYIKKSNEFEIDAVKSRKYILAITGAGKIEKI